MGRKNNRVQHDEFRFKGKVVPFVAPDKIKGQSNGNVKKKGRK